MSAFRIYAYYLFFDENDPRRSPLQAGYVELVARRDPYVLHEYHPRRARPESALPLDLRRLQSRRAPLDDVSPNLAHLVPRPHDI